MSWHRLRQCYFFVLLMKKLFKFNMVVLYLVFIVSLDQQGLRSKMQTNIIFEQLLKHKLKCEFSYMLSNDALLIEQHTDIFTPSTLK